MAMHWIPDVETPDPGSSPGQALIRGRDDRDGVWDDKTKGRGTFAESPVAARLSTAASSDIGHNLVHLR